jgi:hypothetical protein
MLPFIRRLVPVFSCLDELSLSYVRVLGNVPLQDGELMPPMCRPPWGFPPSMSPPLSYAIYLRISWALTSQIIWISLSPVTNYKISIHSTIMTCPIIQSMFMDINYYFRCVRISSLSLVSVIASNYWFTRRTMLWMNSSSSTLQA